MRRFSSALAVSLLTLAPAHAGSIRERTSYFTVRGATLEQLDRELSRKGPTAGLDGGSHPGATQVGFGGRVAYGRSDGACRVVKTSFTLKLVKILPRWTAPKSASAATAIIWRTLSQDIARHEEDHAKIARNYFKRMESAVRNLGPRRDCDSLEAAVNATTKRYLAMHERAQLDFDTLEGREASWRLRRLLKRNVDEAVAESTN